MKKWLLALLLGSLAAVTLLAEQDSLSQQVLRLLTRDNTWSGVNTYSRTVGIVLESGGVPPTGGTANRIYNLGGNLYWNGAVISTAAGVGTVTSVGLALPNLFTVTGSPVTSSGTLTATLATQSANRIFAGPSTGSAAAPTFRALVAADIPDLSATYLTPAGAQAVSNKTGNISQWTNDSGYLTSASIGTNITQVGTLTVGTWNATVIAGQYGGTGVANTGKTITLGGSFTTSGAFTTTLTVTGNTNVTLPTSGTLVTSAVTTLSSLASIGTISTGVWEGTPITVPFGGTGAATLTGLVQGNGASTMTAVTNSSTVGQVLRVTGAATYAWGALDLADADAVTGVLPAANGGTGIDFAAMTDGQLPIGNGSGVTAATLTGTAAQITVTNGVGSITLSTPQGIATTSTPQFARLGLGTGAGGVAVLKTTGIFDVGLFDNGSCGTADTVTWTAGMVQKSTLTDTTCTYTFQNPTASGTWFTLEVIQDATGGRLVTWPGSVVWEGGAAPTLSTDPNAKDVCSFFYDGTSYLGRCLIST